MSLLPALPALDGLTPETQQKLLALLRKQALLYSDSASMRTETLTELFDGLCAILGVSKENLAVLNGVDHLEEAFLLGKQALERKIIQADDLWHQILQVTKIYNHAMRDTLKSLSNMKDNMDRDFFAQNIPGEIDYQLSAPVPDTLVGVDYLLSWLSRLYTENVFISRFSKTALLPVWRAFCGDWKGLCVNLYEPVAADMLACVLLNKEPDKLTPSQTEYETLRTMLGALNSGERRQLLNQAAQTACRRLLCDTPEQIAYLTRFSSELSVRLDVALQTGDLSGVFPG